MVTAAKMSASQAATYFTKDNYYLADGITEVGRWSGKAAESLGLRGDVEQKQFVEVLNGYKPGTLDDQQIKTLEKLNEREGALTKEAETLAKMPDSEKKSMLKTDLDNRIKAYNEERADFHKDVKTGGLHSQIKALKEGAKNDPNKLKEVRSMERELHGLLKNDFKIGDTVVPSDRENVGTITGFDKDGMAKVSFTNPESGNTVVKSFELQDLTNVSKIDNKDRENAAGGKDGQLVRDGLNEHGIASHRAGYDLTFSAPKSFSTMALAVGDSRLIDIHDRAVLKAMEYIEKEFAQTRTYDDNKSRQRENTENLAYAQFTHYTSRAGDKNATPDPQLHTHNLILNATEAGQKWMSLEPQQIFVAQKLADQIYQNELARGAKELGYGIEWNKHGNNYTAEIKGVDRELIEALSSRTAQINGIIAKEEARLGRPMTAEEKNNVTLSSRASKDEQDIAKLKETWDNTLNDLGYSKEGLFASTKERLSDKTIAAGAEQAVKMAVENLHNQKAVFSEHELTHEALKAAQGSASLDEIRAAVDANTRASSAELSTDTNTFELGRNHNNTGTRMFASGQMLTAEANIEKAVREGKNTGSIMNKADFTAAFEKIEAQKIAEAEAAGKNYYSLTEGQRDALSHIATSGDKYIGIQGDAGSGKTTALERMAKMTSLLQDTLGKDVELIGLAPTNVAAKNIQKDSGITSRTVDSFINKPSEAIEEKQQIYLIDESSMLDTVKMDKLVGIAEKTGAKVVFIGDTKQLKPVGAGAMFDRLQKTGQMEFAHVTEVMRQQTNMTKETATAFKNIDSVGKGLDVLSEKGKLIEATKDGDMNPVRDQFISNAAADYIAGHYALAQDKAERPDDLKNGLDSTIALVSTNEDRHGFNEKIREKLVESGVVSKEGHKINTLEEKRLDAIDSKFAGNYRVGDILVAGNQKGRGKIHNGTKTTVTEVNRADNTMRIEWQTAGGEKRDKWIRAEKAGKDFTAYTPAEKEFAVGDKIAFEKKDKAIGVDNGETGIIKAIGDDGKWTVDKGGMVIAVDPVKYPYVSHGYAMTVHKAQGQSIDRVHVYADSSKGGLSLNAGYVQVTRAKYDLTIYTDNRNNLEKQYKKEQLGENAGDWIDTAKFSGKTHSIDEGVDSNFNNAEQYLIVEARSEQKCIDDHIGAMRQEAAEKKGKAKHHWDTSKGLMRSSQSRSYEIFEAARAGAMEKDMKAGIRYQQLEKLEAQIMERGGYDLGRVRSYFLSQNPTKESVQGFDALQARQQLRLDQMVKDGILYEDRDNKGRYELAVHRQNFKEYRESEKSSQHKSDIANDTWNGALRDKLFEMAKSRTDATLIAGGEWNPKASMEAIASQGLNTKDTMEVFERLQARYERLRGEGLINKKSGNYTAKNQAALRDYVGSQSDSNNAFRGEGDSAQLFAQREWLEKKTSASGRLDAMVKRETHVNLHVLGKDIKKAQRFAAHMINAKGYGAYIVSGVAGVVLGTATTASRGIVGAIYKGVKTIGNELGKMANGIIDDHVKNVSRENIDNGKLADFISGSGERTFEERLKEAAEGKTSFTANIEQLGAKRDLDKERTEEDNREDRSFSDRLKEAAGEKEVQSNNAKGTETAEERNGKDEKEAEKEEERSRDD